MLVRDVAHGQIPRADRGEKHRLAAEWIESLGRPEDHAELVAHHYLSALELTRAAGRNSEALREPASQALADAGDRAFGLNAFSEAARFYEQALELASAPDTRLLLSYGEALHHSGDERSFDELERTSRKLIASGASEQAAQAEALLAEGWWYRGRRDEARPHLQRAEELVRDAPASASKARVLSQVSRYLALAGENAEAIRTGREALAMAEALGLEEVRAHSLDNVGLARFALGDSGGIADIERSIEIALAANSPEAARGYNNLAAILWNLGEEFERGHQYRLEAVRIAERFGARLMARFALAVTITYDFFAGRWDDFLARAREYLEESDRVGASYQDLYLLNLRAVVRLARGDEAAALEDARRALELGRAAGDPQAVLPTLGRVAVTEAELGLLDDAREHARELLEGARGNLTTRGDLLGLGAFAEELELGSEFRSIAARGPGWTRWLEALDTLLEGDYVGAADIVGDCGDRPTEAWLRLRAARRLVEGGRRAEADEQLQKALAFWRSVGGTRYIREGEELLAATG